MKTILSLLFAALLLSGCKNQEVNEEMFSSKSQISQETIKQSQALDKASYAGLEHLFGDTAEIKSEGKFVLLIFGKNNCQWCDRLKDEIKADPQTQTLLQKHFKSYYINLSYSKMHQLDFDGKGFPFKGKEQKILDTQSLAQLFQIRPTPTSIFLDSKGQAILGWPGYFSQEQMQVILKFIIDKEYSQAKNQKELFERIDQRLKEVE